MYDKNSQRADPPICNLVPGFAFYSNMGSSLAENLADILETAAALIATIERKSRQKERADAKPRGRQEISSPLREFRDGTPARYQDPDGSKKRVWRNQ